MLRTIIANAPPENGAAAAIKIPDLLSILECLERLSILERHLSNLVSVAYESNSNESK